MSGKAKAKPIKHRDTTILHLRTYIPMTFGGHLIFPLEGKQIRLKKTVTLAGDSQDVTPDRIAAQAATVGVGCTVTTWQEPAPVEGPVTLEETGLLAERPIHVPKARVKK